MDSIGIRGFYCVLKWFRCDVVLTSSLDNVMLPLRKAVKAAEHRGALHRDSCFFLVVNQTETVSANCLSDR